MYENFVKLVGRASRDSEVVPTSTGKRILKLGLTLEEEITPQNKPAFTKYHFVDIESWWDKMIEQGENIKKGDFVSVEGSLQFDSWDDPLKPGFKRSKLIVKPNSLELVSELEQEKPTVSKIVQNSGKGRATQKPQKNSRTRQIVENNDGEAGDNEIPF